MILQVLLFFLSLDFLILNYKTKINQLSLIISKKLKKHFQNFFLFKRLIYTIC